MVQVHREPYKLRYTSLDSYGFMSYGISEYLRSWYGRFKKCVHMYEIVYTKTTGVYTYKAVYTY